MAIKVVTSTEEEFVVAASLVEPPLVEPPPEEPPPEDPPLEDPTPTLTICPTEITTFVYVVPLTSTDGINS